MAETFFAVGPDGKAIVTNRAAAMAAQDMNTLATLSKQLLGVAAGTAAVGAVVAEPNLLRLLLTAPTLGFLAYHLLKGSDPKLLRTSGGVEIPVGTVFSKVSEKTAALGIFKAKPEHLAPLLGMAVPAGLGLDYLYNRHIKYRKIPNPEAYMSWTGRKLYSAGEGVVNHPMAALTAGAVAGGIGRAQVVKDLARYKALSKMKK
jgi:hypothetical protein